MTLFNTPNTNTMHTLLDQHYTQEQLEKLYNLPKNVIIDGCHVISNDYDATDYLKSVASIKAFPIFGFGTELSKLIANDDILSSNPFRMFDSAYLTESKLLELGFGKTQAKSFFDGIIKTYKDGIPFEAIVKTLNIDGCGKSIIEQFTRFFYCQTYSTSGLTREVWSTLMEFDEKHYFANAIIELKSYGYDVISGIVETVVNVDSIKVMLTGSPKEFGFKTKAEFLAKYTNLIEVKKLQDADFLVTDDIESGSSKMKKAKQLNVNVKTYGGFQI